MIGKKEVEEKSRQFGIHTANVQRDYVFGWLLVGLYSASGLRDVLILKGGNGLRKAYFANTRFSNDLDFSIQAKLEVGYLLQELNRVCDFVEEASGITFEKERNRVTKETAIDPTRVVYQARLYFKDFYGNPDKITISVRLDVTQFDKIYLPVQKRFLIHPYSDYSECKVEITCVKLEEMLGTKLKCLLQRRHSADLYDYVYSIFVNKELDVDRAQIVSTFLKKTIFGRSPGFAKGLFLELPLEVFRVFWDRYIVCPKLSIIDFDFAISNFRNSVEELFGTFPVGYGKLAFFPPKWRNPIIEAGNNTTLLEINYDGLARTVEPYSLVYKTRKDGHGQEYFYCYDTTGGRTGPGIKCLVHGKIRSIKLLDQAFTPRFPVEVCKAGEFGGKTYFSSPFRGSPGDPSRKSFSSKLGITYVIECPYCGRQFRRTRNETGLREHKDKYGNECYGRVGYVADQTYD